uniref:PDZ domain containing ring finger 4 n=1 Tax=Electrophorus electricus TaxID=8005 RepID=A0A4W4EZT5_ELEEL
MGFEIDRFESPVDPDFVCRLCGKVLEEPLTTPCGHVFCSGCVIPWVDKQSSCPVKCQGISTKELNHVLPMKNLILKLDIRCDNYSQGCRGVVKLQHLSDHVEMCDFSSVNCRNKGCGAVLNLKDMDSHMREKCEYRLTEVCKNGCGLMLTLKEKLENHNCRDALRTQNCVLEGKLNSLERQLRRQTIRASNRERSLLAQLSTVHGELQIAALEYQKKRTAYKARMDALSSNRVPLSKGEETRRLTVTLHRSSGSLGFNIVGGRSNFSDGIYVSKIMDNGPADIGGLQAYDRIIKVNGKDLSLVTHSQAVEVFCMARDRVEVEVLRRAAPAKTSNSPSPDPRGVDASTQTGDSLEHKEPVVNVASSTTSLGMTMPDKHKSQESNCKWLQNEVEPRTTTQDKLAALTVCCKTEDGDETGFYVCEVRGLAVLDERRVREGDHIIQYYWITLLDVLLCPAQDDGQLEEDENNLRDDLHMDMPGPQHCQAIQLSGSRLHQREPEEDGGTTDTATVSNQHKKDSGVSRTDQITRNDESSEQENPGDEQTFTSDPLLSPCRSQGSDRGHLSSRHAHWSHESLLSVDGVEFPSEPELERGRFQELLESKCLVSEATPFASATSRSNVLSSRCEEQEVRTLDEELSKVKLECLSFIRACRFQREARGQQPSRDSGAQLGCTSEGGATRGQQRYGSATGIPEQMGKESSSAYNTGESSPSSSPALELPPHTGLSRGTERSSEDAFTHRHEPIPASSKHTLSPIQQTMPTKTWAPSEESGTANQGRGKGHSGRSGPATSLRSPHKHAHIPAHAQHYRSYMHLVQQRAAVEYAWSEASQSRSPRGSPAAKAPKAEWRVKIRNDGTCYVTGRPNREELLRERALRIQQERYGTTTDEETASQLKVGRYWTREERRRHVAQTREHRLHREVARQCHPGQQVRRAGDEGEPNILQLSHKKAMKTRNKKILDNWMTIQELLTHGVKSPDGMRMYSPLLSVTTV